METILDSPTHVPHSGYAGFWSRFLAQFIDGIIISIPFLAAVGIAAFTESAGLIVIFYLIGMIGMWLYYALMESSEKQATLGKQALGLKVTDVNGDRISFGKATGRYFGKLVSGFIMYVGYIMAAFTEKKQGLHDIMAGTLVVKK